MKIICNFWEDLIASQAAEQMTPEIVYFVKQTLSKAGPSSAMSLATHHTTLSDIKVLFCFEPRKINQCMWL